MKIIYFLVCAFLFFDSQVGAARESFTISVGEQVNIEIGSGLQVELSRKGIVDVSFVGRNTIQATGLRRGFVLAKVLSGNKVVKSIPIHVDSASEQRFRSHESMKVNSSARTAFVLTAKIELVENSDYEALRGVDSVSINLHPSGAAHTLAHIMSKNIKKTGVTLCSPSVKGYQGEAFLIRSGSKVALSAHDNGLSSVIDWIESGLTIEGILSNVSSGKNIMGFSAEILSKTSNENEFGRYKIESTVELKAGDFVTVGEIDMAQNSKGEGYLHFISYIPIIGPLFRSNSEMSSKSKMILSIKLDFI